MLHENTATYLTPHDEYLEGWGMRSRAQCHIVQPRTVREVASVFAEAAASGQTLCLRGAGCSYGDAALNRDALVLDCTALNRVLAWNPATGEAIVEPGVTIAQLWQHILPDGWWPAVVPGTSAVTIGGAAAMNVHGKNNWRIGCFGDHVVAFDLLLPSGETITCSRQQNAELFYAAIGGLGLLGCFTALTLRARPIYSGLVCERQTAHDSLPALLAAFEAATTSATDLVAWVDASATGVYLGRGLLKASRDLAPGEDSAPERSLSVASQVPRARLMHWLPEGMLPRLARPLTSAHGAWLANRAQWWRGKLPDSAKPHLTSHAAANFPLDAIPGWKEAYRPGGLIQHQSFIPRAVAAQAFCLIIERSQAAGIPPSFAVLKRHRTDDFLLSCLGDDYSLALDYPLHRGNEAQMLALAATLNDLVAEYGGRCYFAKDSTLTADQVHRMYPAAKLARFLVLKAQCDPLGLLSSDLYRRALILPSNTKRGP